MTLRTLNYGNYGIFLIVGSAGFCPSTVWNWGLEKAEILGLGLRTPRLGKDWGPKRSCEPKDPLVGDIIQKPVNTNIDGYTFCYSYNQLCLQL